MDIIDALERKPNLLFGKGASEEDIDEAEKELSIRLADDYRAYLLKFGIAAFDGHELTGLSNSQRTNVVSLTGNEKSINSEIPADMYVVEDTGMDGILIWQSSSGEVFYSKPMSAPVKYRDSLAAYIDNL